MGPYPMGPVGCRPNPAVARGRIRAVKDAAPRRCLLNATNKGPAHETEKIVR